MIKRVGLFCEPTRLPPIKAQLYIYKYAETVTLSTKSSLSVFQLCEKCR